MMAASWRGMRGRIPARRVEQAGGVDRHHQPHLAVGELHHAAGGRPHQPDQHAEVIGVELGLALLVEAAEAA